jgi:hypothetical protein
MNLKYFIYFLIASFIKATICMDNNNIFLPCFYNPDLDFVMLRSLLNDNAINPVKEKGATGNNTVLNLKDDVKLHLWNFFEESNMTEEERKKHDYYYSVEKGKAECPIPGTNEKERLDQYLVNNDYYFLYKGKNGSLHICKATNILTKDEYKLIEKKYSSFFEERIVEGVKLWGVKDPFNSDTIHEK